MHAAFRLCLPTSRVGESATRQMHANFLAVSVRGVALLRILVVSRHRVALLFRNLQPAMLVLADPTNSECLSGATIQQIQPINQSINQSITSSSSRNQTIVMRILVRAVVATTFDIPRFEGAAHGSRVSG
jgi:hypothetical protein